eukprot:5565480-Pleurochrysis_carterae.AAC.1
MHRDTPATIVRSPACCVCIYKRECARGCRPNCEHQVRATSKGTASDVAKKAMSSSHCARDLELPFPNSVERLDNIARLAPLGGDVEL